MDANTAQLILQDRKIVYFITDRKLRVIEVSGNAQILRQGYYNALGHSLLELVPELVGREAVLAELLAGQTPRFELAGVSRLFEADQIAHLKMVDLPYRDVSGHILGLIHLVQDMTDLGQGEQRVTQQRNELELLRDELNQQSQKLAAAQAELQMLDEMKSGFVAIAAHELRSPLTAITGYLELLLDDGADYLTDLQRDYLNIMRDSAQHLLSITNDLLDLTRIEAGRVELALQPTDLVALIERVACKFTSQIEAKAQRLTLQVLSDLPAALCDSTRTAQVFGNLINNASKYTPEGGSIVVRLEYAAEEGFLLVAVQDDGVGISAPEQNRLFERFFRARSAAVTGAGGAGIGLYIARSLVELHGGRIWVESEVGHGAAFYVTFPIADTPMDGGNHRALQL